MNKREREAFIAGAEWYRTVLSNAGSTGCDLVLSRDIWAEALRRWPRKTKTVPRVVTDGSGFGWTVRDGFVEVLGYRFMGYPTITPERVKLWADLLARPTEEVECDDE